MAAGKMIQQLAHETGRTGETDPVCLVHLVDLACSVYLVDLVHLVSLVHLVYPVSLGQPNKQDKPTAVQNNRLLDVLPA